MRDAPGMCLGQDWTRLHQPEEARPGHLSWRKIHVVPKLLMAEDLNGGAPTDKDKEQKRQGPTTPRLKEHSLANPYFIFYINCLFFGRQ
ncbi:hypothetical protein NDU88_005782 [Pleurodeles waltl]|uniref:Uncharacterized protein n=1 Tax=Pleurodeles waltl TaxID=8319 RepID=A0AAV7RND0_PLEWA|nr:hypothetical protein NDU88_005782 [Pleurodeles waltl]